jgi:uncharacterized coiled-coil protein SlyX
MTTLHLKKSIGRSPLRLGFLLIPLVFACFAFFQMAQAQLPPPAPDGGYPNGNTVEGFHALLNVTSGFDNTANGFEALQSNTTGQENTATGFEALTNTTGSFNTATGSKALVSNTTGNANTANGGAALFGNTSGGNNTANGDGALENNTTASNNTATGFNALFSNTTGHDNTAEGFQALLRNTGLNNIALGSNAGVNLTTGSNNIDIGNLGVAGEAAKIRIGTVGTQKATFIAGIHGVTVASGLDVVVGTNGQLGTITSSARFTEAIKPMDKTSEAILALKPVTFRYKKELDPDGIPQFGLVAEQVEKVNPDLVVRDTDGKVNTVRYEAVNAMLLNEFLKEHKRVEDQDRRQQEQEASVTQLKSTVAKQDATIAQQQKQIEALTATVQKVSDQIALGKPAPQLVANP